MLLASTAFLDSFWGAVVREILLCTTVFVLLAGLLSVRSILKSLYELVESLLDNMCDGYLLLHTDGTIAYADPNSTDTLGIGIGDASFCSGRGVEMGIRTLRMTVRGKRLEIETYTIPCPLPAQGVSLILARSLPAPAPLAVEGSRKYLCTIRIRQEHAEGEGTSAAFAPPRAQVPGASRPMPSTPLRGHEAAAALKAPEVNSKHLIRPEFRADSGELPPMSELGSVLLQSKPSPGLDPKPHTLPGSPWQAIQAVGLGVGNYKKVRMIGRGGQGSVWQVISQDGIQYAQKDISLKGVLWHVDFPKRLRDADREVRALKGLAWASCVIVPIIDCWIQNDFEQACIVMEWLPLNLNEVLKQQRKEKRGGVPLADACNWLAHIAVGVAAIHWAGFIHRDLKTANILLDEQKKHCKIADLGVSRPLHRKQTQSQEADDLASQVSVRSEKTKLSMATSVEPQSILSGYTVRPGTNAYTSPEALQSSDYGSLSDVFSLGCVLLEVLTLEMPPELQFGEVESSVPARARELLAPVSIGGDTEAELRALCLRMLSPRADDRPSAQEVATRPLLRKHVEKLVQECAKLRSVLSPGL